MRIHLILRSIWPQRTHSEDVHVGVVEILCLGDGAYPAILPNKSLLGGVAMEMRVSCRTPVLPRIGFGADLTRRKRRARRSNTLPRQLTRLLRAARQLLFGFTWSIQRKKYTPPTSTTRFAATSSWGMRRACVMPAQARSDRCGIVSDDVAICSNVQTVRACTRTL